MDKKMFSKDFVLVVIGQIISLFGNAALRFALPLYLLNQTGSSALFGAVTACAFIPSILLSPVGGIIADRVNKRNIMVALDFLTAALVLGFMLLMDTGNLILLLTVTLMILYGIAGAYQPAVQASIPVLVASEHLMAANAVINTISSFSALIGPVIGGILYSAYGLRPVLQVSMACFFLSAVMELFIRIPFVKQPAAGSMMSLVRGDFSASLRFIRRERPIIGKSLLVVCAINLFLSAMVNVGMPYLITEVMEFTGETANRLYGYSQGAMAAGGLAGGIGAGLLAGKLSVRKAGNLLVASAVCVFPMGTALAVQKGFAAYLVLVICCFAVVLLSTMFSVQILSFVQAETPQHLIGKVIAVMLTVSMCAHPAGSALYGILFEVCVGFEYAAVLFAGVVSLAVAAGTRRIFSSFETGAEENITGS